MDLRLRIAVADDEPDMQQYFRKILPRLGHDVVSVAATGRELVQHVRTQQPDLVITDIKMPEMDGIEAANEIYRLAPVPVILVSAFHDRELIGRARNDHIMAYLVKPIKQADLEPAIALATIRFKQLQEVQCQAASLKQALEDRAMETEGKTVHEIYERMRADHEALRELLGELHRTVAERQEPISHVREMLSSLCEQIETHFQEEDESQFFEHIVDRAAWLADRAAAIHAEHDSLRVRVARLREVAMANTGDDNAAWWDQLEIDFRNFSRELMHHESRETDLLQAAYSEDIGSAD